jgi:hypothetical protein
VRSDIEADHSGCHGEYLGNLGARLKTFDQVPRRMGGLPRTMRVRAGGKRGATGPRGPGRSPLTRDSVSYHLVVASQTVGAARADTAPITPLQ